MRPGDRTGPGRSSDEQRTGPDRAKQDQPPPCETGPPAGSGGSGRGSGGGARRTVLIVAAAVVVVVGAVVGILLSSSSPKASHPMAVESSARATGHPSVRPSLHPSPGVPHQTELSLHEPGGKNVFGDVFGSETVLATGDSNGNSYVWNLVSSGHLISTLQDRNSNGINDL